MHHEPRPHEAHLAHARQQHPERDDQHGAQRRHARVRQRRRPRHEQRDHGRQRLEHLDEGHRQVQVREVGAPERHRVQEADGQDRAQVQAPRDGRHPARPRDEARVPREELRQDGGGREVERREGYGCCGSVLAAGR